LRYFIDRSLGSVILPRILREDDWQVTTMDERYGADASQSVADSDWIERMAQLGEIALTSDKKIGKVPIQAEAIRRSSARILVIDANMTARRQAARLMANRIGIERLAGSRPGPWVVSLGSGTMHELRLRP
jgi:hypothetical protein